MRREAIYPHRSIRSLPLSRPRIYAALAYAAILTGTIWVLGTPLLGRHGDFCSFVLKQTGIPTTGSGAVDVFPGIGPVAAPNVPFPSHRANPLRTVLLFAVSIGVLLMIHRQVPLSRNFLVFLMILLCAAVGVIVFGSSFHFDSAMFTQIWLKGEVLVWLLLPWFSIFLFALVMPSFWKGVVCALAVQAYVIFWSALRLAFCLGVLHFTGILFLPLLWFCLGLLFDLVCLVFFYSLVLQSSVRSVLGARKP